MVSALILSELTLVCQGHGMNCITAVVSGWRLNLHVILVSVVFIAYAVFIQITYN